MHIITVRENLIYLYIDILLINKTKINLNLLEINRCKVISSIIVVHGGQALESRTLMGGNKRNLFSLYLRIQGQ